MPGHDIIVIGASAGGVNTVTELVGLLPKDLPATLFVVLHISPYSRSYLPEILNRNGSLPASHAVDQEQIEPGRIYIAPPDHHLLVGKGQVRVVQGPKENNSRPAIDPLFRTAALSYSRRVVGVILSGTLDDGTAGIGAVKVRGGVTVVQDPKDALHPEMPFNALKNNKVDYCLPVSAIGSLLRRLVHEPVSEEEGELGMTDELEFEAHMAAWDLDALHGKDRPGKPSPFVCPNCKGDLWEIMDGDQFRYRCRTGHAWSPLSLLAGQSEALDETLNEAFRALMEKAHLEQRLARRSQEQGGIKRAEYHKRQAENAEKSALMIRDLLMTFQALSENPPPLEEENSLNQVSSNRVKKKK